MPEWLNLNLIALAMLALFVLTLLPSIGSKASVVWGKLIGLVRPPAETVADDHALYTAFLAIRKATAKDPQATTALDRLVLPALISGQTDPNYHVCWEGGQPLPPHREAAAGTARVAVAGTATGGQS
jgi:hypothetical protein